MTNKRTSVPVGMMTGKFYCHRCGEQMGKAPRTRMVHRGDPDYHEHNRIGRMTMFGDIEVTEYDFRCAACDTIIRYDEQRVVEYIQQRTGRKILFQWEIDAEAEEAGAVLRSKERRRRVVATAISIVIAIIILYFQFRG